METTTATAGRPNAQRSDERRTTLLDLLLDLCAHCDTEQSLVSLAIGEITTGEAVLCGSYRGVDPAQFTL